MSNKELPPYREIVPWIALGFIAGAFLVFGVMWRFGTAIRVALME